LKQRLGINSGRSEGVDILFSWAGGGSVFTGCGEASAAADGRVQKKPAVVMT